MNETIKTPVEKSTSQMRKGILEFCILLIIARGEVYASDILKSLSEVGISVVEGTLYPLLMRLKKEGMLGYSWSESPSGPPRKYYSLTEQGQTFLSELKANWTDLYTSIEKLINHEKNNAY
jgi:PadR family transcriptional regulator PadR